MTTTEHFNRTRSGVVGDSTDERARRAVKVFRGMQYGLSSYARAITGNPKVSVEMKAGTPHTDGTKIYYQPPIALGDPTEHDRAVCEKRGENLKKICPACAIREQVYVNIIHEIGHIAFESFAETSEHDRKQALNAAIEEWGGEYEQQIRKRWQAAPLHVTRSYMGLAQLVSPYLPYLVNCLEDARIDSAMFRARKGVRTMMGADMHSLLAEGVEQADGTHSRWADAPLNAQASIACYIVGVGLPDLIKWLHADVIEAFKDEKLLDVLGQVDGADSARDTYNLSFPVLARLRELGFFKTPEDQEEEQDDSSGDSSDGEEASDQASDEDGDSSGEKSDDSSDDREDGSPERDDEQPSQSDGSDDQDAGDSEAGDSVDERSDDEEGSSDSDPVSDESSDGADEPADDGGHDESASEDQSSGGSEGDESEDSGGGSDNESTPDEGDGSTGTSEGDSDSAPDGDDSEEAASAGESDNESSEGTGGPDDPGEPTEGSQDGTHGADEAQASDPTSGPTPTERIDTGADEGVGGEQVDKPDYGEPGDLNGVIEQFHKDDVAIDHDHHQSPDEDEAVTIAIVQGLYFETPSQNILGVREHYYDKPIVEDGKRIDQGWANERYLSMLSGSQREIRQMMGIEIELDVPESVLGPALLQTRRVFTDNAVADRQNNLKSGRINKRVLGRRAWNNDPRLFSKKRLPGKRSYAVLIGIDISGSTLGENIALAKRAAWAQAELCDRAGVDFAVYAHSASGRAGAVGRKGLHLDIYHVKDFEEPWNPKVQERLRQLGSDSENLDGHTLEWYRKRIMQTDATDKIILYYTDGKMPAANHAEELQILQREIRYCQRDQVTLLGVGIRTDSPRRHGLDTVQVTNDSDLKAVVMHLDKRLVRVAR